MSTSTRGTAAPTAPPASSGRCTRQVLLPPNGTSIPETSSSKAHPAADKGKAPMGARPKRPGKRTRFADDALLSPDPVAIDFDPFAELDPMWSSGPFQSETCMWQPLTE